VLSLNVPLPGEVRATVDRLRPFLEGDRHDHTLVCKRLGETPATVERKRVRRALGGWAPFELRITGIEAFDQPVSGEGSVVYLAVQSPRLEALHEHLCGVIDPVAGVEGEDYVPHVTIGRTTDADRLASILGRSVDTVRWTADALEFWDARHGETAGRIALPG
jgi:2'-5' RNA ligase